MTFVPSPGVGEVPLLAPPTVTGDDDCLLGAAAAADTAVLVEVEAIWASSSAEWSSTYCECFSLCRLLFSLSL
ncbi:MAG: hypothetical protein MJE68_02720 [Proteobacteria bacterium]|nr:hypothetical protein [Pseudomonadota bacterium]